MDPGVIQLLRLAGSTYLPFLIANEVAVEQRAASVKLEALGRVFEQTPFRYQVKCLRRLRHKFAALEGSTKRRTEELLEATGCLSAFRQ